VGSADELHLLPRRGAVLDLQLGLVDGRARRQGGGVAAGLRLVLALVVVAIVAGAGVIAVVADVGAPVDVAL
jgi:hypothetical protein